MRAEAYAKVNLGLRVHSPDPTGYHPITGLNQSVGWSDVLELEAASEDHFDAPGAVPDDVTNLAWMAVEMARDAAGTDRAVALGLTKRLPIASGLAGGSADAAAALGLAAELFGLPLEEMGDLAPRLGADVPFCFTGGLAVVTGYGERVSSRESITGFALAIVVPPFELSTSDVYASWDRLDEPEAPSLPATALPPGLREYHPLGNDLYPAAVALRPALDEWRAELSARWERPASLSGSGPALFGYFLDVEEAAEALRDLPAGARAAQAVSPVPRGWQVADGTLNGAG